MQFLKNPTSQKKPGPQTLSQGHRRACSECKSTITELQVTQPSKTTVWKASQNLGLSTFCCPRQDRAKENIEANISLHVKGHEPMPRHCCPYRVGREAGQGNDPPSLQGRFLKPLKDAISVPFTSTHLSHGSLHKWQEERNLSKRQSCDNPPTGPPSGRL